MEHSTVVYIPRRRLCHDSGPGSAIDEEGVVAKDSKSVQCGTYDACSVDGYANGYNEGVLKEDQKIRLPFHL